MFVLWYLKKSVLRDNFTDSHLHKPYITVKYSSICVEYASVLQGM